jgi:hypothetical protein
MLERLEARPTRSGSSLIVAVNALTLKRLPLPKAEQQDRPSGPISPRPQQATA